MFRSPERAGTLSAALAAAGLSQPRAVSQARRSMVILLAVRRSTTRPNRFTRHETEIATGAPH